MQNGLSAGQLPLRPSERRRLRGEARVLWRPSRQSRRLPGAAFYITVRCSPLPRMVDGASRLATTGRGWEGLRRRQAAPLTVSSKSRSRMSSREAILSKPRC